MALSAARNTKRDDEAAICPLISLPVKAGVTIYAGALVALSAGYARPGITASDLYVVGRAEQTIDNSAGQDGTLAVKVRQGTFKWDNDSTDPLSQADVGRPCYIKDDATVCKTGAGKSVAGRVVRFDSDGVAVVSFIGVSSAP